MSPGNITDQRAGTSGFCLIYQDVLTHPDFLDLSRGAVLCYLFIGSHTGGASSDRSGVARAGPTSKAWRLSIARFCQQLKMSRSQVFRALEALTKKGLLTRAATGSASWFTLHDPVGVGARRFEQLPEPSTKHAKLTYLGVKGLTVREGLALRGCVALVSQYEALQGRAVSLDTWVACGLFLGDHDRYTAAYPARMVSQNCDVSEMSQFCDVNAGNIAEVRHPSSQNCDTLETLPTDLLKAKNNPSSSESDGPSVEGYNTAKWDDRTLLCVETWLGRLARIFPIDGRPLSPFLRRSLCALKLDESLAANGLEPDLPSVARIDKAFPGLLDQYQVHLDNESADPRSRFFSALVFLVLNELAQPVADLTSRSLHSAVQRGVETALLAKVGCKHG